MRGSIRRWLLRAHIPLSIRSSSSLPPWCRKIRRRSRVIRHPHPTSMVALLNFQTVRYFASRRFGMPFLIWRYRHPSYYLKNRVQPRQGGKNSWKPYDMVQYAHQPKKGLASLLERNLGIIFWPFLSLKKPVFSTYLQFHQHMLSKFLENWLISWNWAFFCKQSISWKNKNDQKVIKNAEMYFIFRANRR